MSTLEILNTTGDGSVELGRGANAPGDGAIAVGAVQGDPDAGDVTTGAFAEGDLAQAYGPGAVASGDGAVQIGAGENSTDNTLQFQDTRIPMATELDAVIDYLNGSLLQAGGLDISATPEEVKTTVAVIANITGIQATGAIDATLPFTAVTTVAISKFGAILMQVSSAGVLSSKAVGADQAYDTLDLAIAALPDADAGNQAFGYVTIEAGVAPWVGKTSDMTDGSDLTAATFVDLAVDTIATV